MLKRDEYIKQIVPFINKDVIKVLTGIRRSGKSVMLKLLMEELKKRKINENQKKELGNNLNDMIKIFKNHNQ